MEPTNTETTLGSCSFCEAALKERHVIIEYTIDDEPRCWAECPQCGEIVDPLSNVE